MQSQTAHRLGSSAPQLAPGLNSLQRDLSGQFSSKKGHAYSPFPQILTLRFTLATYRRFHRLAPNPVAPAIGQILAVHPQPLSHTLGRGFTADCSTWPSAGFPLSDPFISSRRRLSQLTLTSVCNEAERRGCYGERP